MTAPEDDEDRHLMIALAGGNDPALNVLMRRWNVRLTSYLDRLCGSHATACDLAQETFVRVYKHRHRFRTAQKFSTWLFAIATNLARNHARWQKRHPVTLLEPEQVSDLPLPCGQPCPSGHMEQEERAEAVRAAILKLPPEQKETLILSTYEGMTHSEIATIMETSEKVVEMRLYRARKQLKELLQPWLKNV
ncbi:RNA polymerase sigma-70 factor (ECF subfamily) [Prosthecobacter fusiformis]|uniref:RNA polymerase sigma-70 factor (ECF subfamily) n=1 Tax=Prosthecobacter fusiformis TaxID=48464 RepID=A0A4R7RZF0_9BACT|nr:sigma-70 family RNA polymerase sigma factor [Prosthecobacter fusiformis]TDU71241.1 RNA polymerase sigma-70 factor (ECF subfamily) [Prosthecobacter fusiformis]